ncbi:MAG: hypothetical protein ABIT05_02110 [Chitinophagaceae bacterium]
MTLGQQIIYLFLLAIPVACISWTVTHEEVFREPREYFTRCSQSSRSLLARKFFYLLTCEYCFSHYVTIGMLVLTDYHLVFSNWKGLLIGGFSLVWIANIYMSLFYKIRIDIKKEKVIIEEKEQEKEETGARR